jgi:hypothetical protein
VRKAQPSSKTGHRQPIEALRPQDFVPRRKSPWLLALCGIVLISWLVFLAYLAYRG